MKITLAWLYPKNMNLYGDRGNIIALCYRAKQRNIEIEIKNINIAGKFIPDEIDLAFFGGGQDKEQLMVAKDFLDKKQEIIKFYQAEKPMLAVCGGYQLLGDYFLTNDKKKINGLGIFRMITVGSKERMIGNISIKSRLLGNDKIVGFENHSGKTMLEDKEESLGQVIKGYGNNGDDKTEGIKSNNFIGTYLHGPLLPRNPKLADWLIAKALEIKYNKAIKLAEIDDDWENKARESVRQ